MVDLASALLIRRGFRQTLPSDSRWERLIFRLRLFQLGLGGFFVQPSDAWVPAFPDPPPSRLSQGNCESDTSEGAGVDIEPFLAVSAEAGRCLEPDADIRVDAVSLVYLPSHTQGKRRFAVEQPGSDPGHRAELQPVGNVVGHGKPHGRQVGPCVALDGQGEVSFADRTAV